jgi:PTH1 family peptidyl-tRNA hydrolase
MGIGHPGHKDAVAAYVLHDFAKADQAWLEDLLRGISDGAGLLAAGDGPKFLNAVALVVAPPRPSTGPGKAGAGPTAAPAAPQPASPETPRTALQRLADRFRQS